MPEFEALGRDAAAAAHSITDDGTGKLGRTIVGLLDWFGDEAANHLLHVEASKDEDGASITVTVKERDVYQLPVFAVPDPVAAPHDAARDEVEADESEPAATAAGAETVVTVTEAPDGTEVTPAPAEEPASAPEAAA